MISWLGVQVSYDLMVLDGTEGGVPAAAPQSFV